MAVSNEFEVLIAQEDTGELWNSFVRETLEAAEEYTGQHPRPWEGVALKILENIEEWITNETLEAAEKYTGEHPKPRKGVALKKTLGNIEDSNAADSVTKD